MPPIDPAPVVRLALAALMLLGTSTVALGDSGLRLDEVGRTIESVLASSTRPGWLIGVTDRLALRKVIVHGYANLGTKAPLTAESRFAIGSISKSFTSIALLQLEDEGRFDPQAPITRYLPSLKIPSKFAAMTGRDLMSHTAGLPGYLADSASSRFAEIELGTFEPTYPPGQHWMYSNTGYQLLGYALEDIEKAPYARVIGRRILEPLAMTSTSAVIDDAQRTHMVVSYQRWPYDGKYVEAPWFEYTAGDGSLVSTVRDMGSYLRFILNRGALGKTRVLSDRAFTELTRPVLDDYGYGLWIHQANGDTVISHSGSIAGFTSYIEAHLDEGFGVVMLANGGMDSSIKDWILKAVAAVYEKLPIPPAPRPPLNLLAVNLREYAGHYVRGGAKTGSDFVDVILRNRELAVKDTQGTVTPLQRIGVDSFRVRGDSNDALAFIFGRVAGDPRGKVMELSHGDRWYVNQASTRPVAPPGEDYSALVGHYTYNGPEGPDARIFVRDGQLTAALGWDEQLDTEPLIPMAPGIFRMGKEPYSPERATFDAVVDAKAQRLTLSGVPLYRRDTP